LKFISKWELFLGLDFKSNVLYKSIASENINFQHSEKFQGNSVFQGKKVVQKSEINDRPSGQAKKGVPPLP